ncbi:hypothetical protein Ddc_14663 [Ditylenchus destructor]|nr:hypothetical protein Ddc_14663 [Ditylenchus destructor]
MRIFIILILLLAVVAMCLAQDHVFFGGLQGVVSEHELFAPGSHNPPKRRVQRNAPDNDKQKASGKFLGRLFKVPNNNGGGK